MTWCLAFDRVWFCPKYINVLRDALSLRHERPMKDLLAICPRGQKYKVTCTFNCKKGGFVTTRYNNLRDFEDMLSRVFNNVETKPELHPVTGEIIEELSVNASRLNIRARGVWRACQNAYF